MLGVAHEIKGGRLWARDCEVAPGCVDPHHRHLFDVVARDEANSYPAAVDLSPILRHDDLKELRLLMGGTMVSGSSQKTGIVGSVKPLHELRDELIRRQAAKGLVLGRNDEVETAVGSGDEPLFLEPPEGRACRSQRDAELSHGFSSREMIVTPCGQTADHRVCRARFSLVHLAKVLKFGAFVE